MPDESGYQCDEVGSQPGENGSQYDEIGNAEIDLQIRNHTLTLIFTDSGIPYDPLKKVITPEEYDVDQQIGGLGKLMAFTIMDSAEYDYKDGKNILTLKKDIEK